jgi:hypothetical protein
MILNAFRKMKKIYQKEVLSGLERTNSIKPELLLEDDIQHLPQVVQKYLRYVGAVGKEKVVNTRICFEGRIRSKKENSWMKLQSEQYNFFDNPKRAFYIKASKMGIPATGLHLYKDETAIMVIKLAGLFKIADAKGPEMDQGETVTLFNDMCFMAPATLIDKNITWEIINPLTVKAKYINGKLNISANLFFNEKGEMINFISNDRFETIDGKTFNNYPWSTPVSGYRKQNGRMFPVSAKAIYHKPDGEFCYGEFTIKEVEYNCREMK